MDKLKIIPYYISWHYGHGIKDLLGLWKNFLWFVPSFFSIGTLFKTLFSPFERLSENYRGGLDVENFLSTLAVNMMMRLVGMFVRLFLIIVGIISYIFTVILGLVVFIGWLMLPVLIIFLLFLSLRAFFNTP